MTATLTAPETDEVDVCVQVNPHVATILDAQRAQGATPLCLPRTDTQTPVASLAGPAAALAGVSAFAFQGTNAHAILALQADSSGGSSQAAPSTAALKLQRSRHWFTDWQPHALVQRAVCSPGRLLHVEAALSCPQLAFLWDHQVLPFTWLTAGHGSPCADSVHCHESP